MTPNPRPTIRQVTPEDDLERLTALIHAAYAPTPGWACATGAPTSRWKTRPSGLHRAPAW